MELLFLVLAIAAVVALYFGAGIALKFIVTWWVIALISPILLAVGVFGGWIGALLAIAGLVAAVHANNRWHGSSLYQRIEAQIDKLFYLADT